MTDLLKPGEAAKEFGYSVASLKRWEKDGRIKPSYTPGGQRRYTRESLQALAQPIAKQDDSLEFANKPTNRQIYKEFGSTDLSRFGGSVTEERLRELQGYQGRILYREMRQNDPVIAAMFFAITMSLRQTDKRIAPASEKTPDKECADFVESCFGDMSFSWNDTFTAIVEPMLEQGFSLLELIYKKRLGDNPPKYTDNPAPSQYDDGRIGWRKWGIRPADSLAPGSEWIFDENGGLKGINQSPSYDLAKATVIPIPMEKLLHFRTTVHPANTPEPPPIHRAAYLPYYYSQNIQEIEGIGIERDLNGIPVVYMGYDRSFEGENNDYDEMVKLVTNIRWDEQVGVVFPGPKMGAGENKGEGFLLELLASNSTRAHNLNEIIDRYDKRKALVVLAQFIMLGMEQVGSYALSRHQGDLFSLAVTAWLDSIADIINRHAIPRLIRMNSFPGITGLPKLIFSPIGIPDLATVAEYVNKLVDKSVLTPDEELERHLRMIADFPEKVKEKEEGKVADIDLDKASLRLTRMRTALEPLVQTGMFSPEEYATLVGDELNTIRGSKFQKHAGAVSNIPCPFCQHQQTEVYKDHGGVAVCPQCEMSFSPEFHYGGHFG